MCLILKHIFVGSAGLELVIIHSEVAYTMHCDFILIEIHKRCVLNSISVHTRFFSPRRFGAFPAPSSGTFDVSIHTHHTRQWFIRPYVVQNST